jgi:hypothetical protein
LETCERKLKVTFKKFSQIFGDTKTMLLSDNKNL